MTYDTTFMRLRERLLDACDDRMQALNAIGWFGDDESIAEIKDDDLRDMAVSLDKQGYVSFMSVIDNMIWTIYNDLGVDRQLPNLYYDIVIDSEINTEFHYVPVIRLRATYIGNGQYALYSQHTRDGVDYHIVLPAIISRKCLDTLDYIDWAYLTTHTLNKDGDNGHKPMADYVLKHITDYDVIIKIDIKGNITYHRCDK